MRPAPGLDSVFSWVRGGLGPQGSPRKSMLLWVLLLHRAAAVEKEGRAAEERMCICANACVHACVCLCVCLSVSLCVFLLTPEP